jgi:hypothetical protein
MFQAECPDRPKWVVSEDLSNPNLLGAREHRGAIRPDVRSLSAQPASSMPGSAHLA